MTAPIQTVSTYPRPSTQISVDDGLVTLGATASFRAALLGADNLPTTRHQRFSLTPEEYANWTGGDIYIVGIGAQRLGVTLLN